jgi:hypothetical protein
VKRRGCWWLLIAVVLLAAAVVDAQSLTAEPPGPYVVDLRGATGGLPQAATFYPAFPAGTHVPQRGFGFGVGAHLYPLHLGGVRIGVGADFTQVRGTAATPVSAAATATTTPTPTTATTTPTTATTTDPAATTPIVFPDVTTTARFVAPQVSFNFGNRDGWSYLSAGITSASVAVRGSGDATLRQESGTLTGWNVGGGARWFLRDHFGTAFDVRFHHFDGSHVFSVTAGISLR